ncbi:39S ribosomal protein L9, mitochondrial-like [Homarus americanus]|uniref:39S ribosomal protein L9-like n=1 Tax=Homarus americanus TaxID=6706 RepID=A0A8J5JWD4_HOMAM|nr:39S ribosomal protein L9, mitochondrial-like [Homarus americanus]XP_042229078.1 39S ribosomal protein L9, mitochondrial-like [Homarus americanus]XP_042229079.1 39S ribosomal protein L9, mitochondrial-like [Homarus americanus]KAG7165087.1 39S ribosomal protein L9-like [Homarus americanus]
MLRSVVQGLANLHLKNTGLAISRGAGRTLTAKDVETKVCGGPLLQQVRTTFILKRVSKSLLRKTHKKTSSRKMKARDFVYKLVEDTNVRKKEPLKVILLASVDGLGSKGQIVEVKPSRARYHLLLPGLAVYASPENIEKYSNIMKQVSEDEDQPSSQFARKTVQELSSRVISVSMNMKNPWKVEPWHVRVAFRKAGIVLPEEALTLPSNPIVGPDLSLQEKEFLVKVKVNNKEEAPVRCRIHHYATNPRERIPWKGFHWEYPAEPLFLEEAPVLEELTKNNPITRYVEEEEQ